MTRPTASSAAASHPLVARLAAGPLLADGAMGTMLYAEGASLDDCFDALNLEAPATVSAIHRAYLESGAGLIKSNTFGANRFKLAAFGLEGKVRAINRAGAKLAREAREIAGSGALVAGSAGPTGRTLQPWGTADPAEVQAAFREQIEALLEGGVDLLLLETFGSVEELELAIAAAREACDLPICASLTFAEDGRTLGGATPEEAVARLAPLGLASIGANCSVGPQRLLPVVTQMAHALADLPPDAPHARRPALSCMPNAGWPAQVAGRVIYPSSPEYFADFARRAAALGVGIIGGCCGTTPAHTAAMRGALLRAEPGTVSVTSTAPATAQW
ncbi:MAG: homocysteine S-methyltransferase family protein, partial [Chloroflexota bacterium]